MSGTMRAMLLTGHGGLDMLSFTAAALTPQPGAGEVLVKVRACGMNNTDVNTRTGWYSKTVTTATSDVGSQSEVDGSWGGGLEFPRIQGADPTGHIVEAGSGVPSTRVGERVLIDAWVRDPQGALDKAKYLGSELDGGFAEFVVVPSANAHRIETDLSDVELASFPCSYATAEHMLHRAAVTEGQWVLVTGASGGVGGGLIQLAKRRGAQVAAITSHSKIDAVRATGADVVLDRTDPHLVESVREATGGVDVFADVVGGESFGPLLEVIRRGGHYTTAGAIGGPIVRLDLRTLYLNDLTMHGATVLPRAVFADLITYIEQEEIKPIVAATYPLEDLAAAQDAFMRKEHVGAFVIEI